MMQQVSFVADEAFYRDGILTFRGVRVDFVPSERPHEDLLAPLTEVEVPTISTISPVERISEQVQVVDEEVRTLVDDGLQDEDTQQEDDVTYEEEYQDHIEDDGEVAPMDLSD